MTEIKQPYESLLVWQRADTFVVSAYKATKLFPREELYGIVSQLRRAALSVPLNIIEGRARAGPKEYRRFLYISRGSLTECAYLLDISCRLGYLSTEDFQNLESQRQEVSYLLQRLLDSLQ